MVKVLCYKYFTPKKDKESNEGSFPGKRGGSLGSLKYKVFPCQNHPSQLFTNLFLSNLLRSQVEMKNTILCKENNAKQLNNTTQVIKAKQFN